MAIYFQGKKISRMGALTEPSTYDADTPPVDVQLGAVYYAQGERRTGSGKAFEFAEYGSKVMSKITDNNGVERYGAGFSNVKDNANVVFVTPSTNGDIILQGKYLVSIGGDEVKLGDNHSTENGELVAYYDGKRMIVYLTEHSAKTTILRFFVGKDNHI